MNASKFKFETSAPLKSLLSEPFENWKKRHGGDLSELAYQCGVSTAYLSHVRRYGRIPGRPVLILLALTLKLDGQKLYDAAGINDKFPFERNLEITRPTSEQEGLFSFRFNMDTFSDSIRSIVRSELQSRSVKDLLGNRPLRIGMNYHMFWMFNSRASLNNQQHTGPFPELAEMIGIALQKEVELVSVPFTGYIDALSNHKIDMFGPTMIVPNLPADIIFTRPLFRCGVSALFRKKEHQELESVTKPTLGDLRDPRYQIALLRNSLHHLIANTKLNRPDSTLIFCSTDEEAIERLTLKGISRPAHVFLTNSIRAITSFNEHPKELEILFGKRDSLVDLAEVGIAVRPDWPELMPVINDAIKFLYDRGGVTDRISKAFNEETRQVVALD